jgi:uncharacterized membrane protein YoaK (UPF0700 family)
MLIVNRLHRNHRDVLLAVLRVAALASFIVGSFTGGQLGTYFGDKRRSWLIGTSLIQAGVLGACAVVLMLEGVEKVDSLSLGPVVIGFVSLVQSRNLPRRPRVQIEFRRRHRASCMTWCVD